MFLSFDELRRYKNSHIAVFLGSGSSVNDITDEQWETLKKFDLWAINNWVYHPTIVPKFYHIEVKKIDAQIVKERLEEKWDRYKDVLYVQPKLSDQLAIKAIGHPTESKIFLYEPIKRGEHPKVSPGQPINAVYNPNERIPVKSYDASVTVLIDILYKFGYRYIILVGVDISDSRYFWTDGDPNIYGKVHLQWNNQNKGKKADEPHNTNHVVKFIDDFNRRHMIPNKREIFIQSKKSYLYKYLRHIEI